jgi:hypothetical protein
MSEGSRYLRGFGARFVRDRIGYQAKRNPALQEEFGGVELADGEGRACFPFPLP